MSNNVKVLYRIHDTHIGRDTSLQVTKYFTHHTTPSSLDGYDYDHNLYLTAFFVVKNTEKGVWIDVNGEPKFVLLKCRKQYAYENFDDALKSFLARKTRQIGFLTRKLEEVKISIKVSDGITEASFKNRFY